MTPEWFPESLCNALTKSGRESCIKEFMQLVQHHDRFRHGHKDKWFEAIGALKPGNSIEEIQNTSAPSIGGAGSQDDQVLENALQALMPWRMGQFELAGRHIDTEWRSDLKFNRLSPHIGNISGQHILDVGCGNGYFALRLAAAGAASVIGIDPTPLFVAQYQLLQRLGHSAPVTVLPLMMQDLAESQQAFDTVLSMGVLYHRRDPLEHLRELRAACYAEGQVVIETLVIPGDETTVLMPKDRYARMRNVWFIPSSQALTLWLRRLGYRDVRLVDTTNTTIEEQRASEFMPFDSLAKALDPTDPTKTIEGHPAPSRAIFIATA
ncbi:MAG: tRNA 5-methoxyuridine(34)/uridine 5-oxyacetic acid(34) synthase CmoB [Pseudomonadota bacterium]